MSIFTNLKSLLVFRSVQLILALALLILVSWSGIHRGWWKWWDGITGALALSSRSNRTKCILLRAHKHPSHHQHIHDRYHNLWNLDPPEEPRSLLSIYCTTSRRTGYRSPRIPSVDRQRYFAATLSIPLRRVG